MAKLKKFACENIMNYPAMESYFCYQFKENLAIVFNSAVLMAKTKENIISLSNAINEWIQIILSQWKAIDSLLLSNVITNLKICDNYLVSIYPKYPSYIELETKIAITKINTDPLKVSIEEEVAQIIEKNLSSCQV